jgi:hypothetical protein
MGDGDGSVGGLVEECRRSRSCDDAATAPEGRRSRSGYGVMPSSDGARRERRRSLSSTVRYRAATARGWSVNAETPVLHALKAALPARAATDRERDLEDGGNVAGCSAGR